MAQLIENYALIGNNVSTALVGKDGSIDWLCFPRFDSASCFNKLLGSDENGYWIICPKSQNCRVTRRYRPGTLVLETEFATDEGKVVLTDCMDHRGDVQDVIRMVRGIEGRVRMMMELAIRFDYGTVVPWVTRLPDGRLQATAGPDRILFKTPVP
ncbi:MAG: glycoside hydrolase family 15 protein, partial [Acidobacteriaceae bacterium]|nr:glycoside hydrolase family 15 protein [Acidobacteriaceae bacterium]